MIQITVLNKGNVPTGPFTRAQVAEKLQSGEFALTDLAFIDGLSEWTPLRNVLAKIDDPLDSGPTLAAAPPSPAVPAYSYAATMAPPTHLVYAGFWLRFVAYMIDSFILGAAFFAVIFFFSFLIGIVVGIAGAHSNQHPAMGGASSPTTPMNFNGSHTNPATVGIILAIEAVVWIVTMLLTWLYFAWLESGPAQATLGKRALGLRVTNLEGRRISFAHASGRFFGKIVSGLTFYIGFIMAGFTERKQALHDMIAGTLVVKN